MFLPHFQLPTDTPRRTRRDARPTLSIVAALTAAAQRQSWKSWLGMLGFQRLASVYAPRLEDANCGGSLPATTMNSPDTRNWYLSTVAAGPGRIDYIEIAALPF